ncbi:hypothetical protein AVEN_230527-1 [Araneus ventricosus]|uniref:Uncharacterized protein n=1 Tax=Araneus ventricosus TaxID=182803 RepID=A0A4Y2N7E8_ARAVE|nr:hypothetical protein AVEN_230527-1 [Araneus ventricosus]
METNKYIKFKTFHNILHNKQSASFDIHIEELTSKSRLGLGRLVMLPVSKPTVWCLLGWGRFKVWLPRGSTSLMWPESLSHSAARLDRLDGAAKESSMSAS